MPPALRVLAILGLPNKHGAAPWAIAKKCRFPASFYSGFSHDRMPSVAPEARLEALKE